METGHAPQVDLGVVLEVDDDVALLANEPIVEIMDTSSPHGMYIRLGMGVSCIDRISLKGFGLNS